MRRLIARAFVIVTLCFWYVPALTHAQAQDEEPEPHQARMMALEQMIGAAGDASFEKFLEENLAPHYVKEMSRAALLDLLRRIRTNCAQAGDIMAAAAGDDGVDLTFVTLKGTHTVHFRIERTPPHKIVALTLVEGEAAQKTQSQTLTWDELPAQLEKKAATGFSGTVLVVRDNKVVLHRGYGLANRERNFPNTTETIFAIGSTPIDFTKAAILKLEDMGDLKTSDPLTKFFPNVPDDKLPVTLDHLLQGTSGLPNFHHVPGQDEDYDLTWIDRDEAVRRILGKELLFPPGEGEAHSHSAWGLLAAVIEIVSRQTYAEFLQEHFFEPLGMERTGLYPLTKKFDEKDVAVGYGSYGYGKVNSPASWGETSWLVMGSGGMISNPGDLYQWVAGIRSGRTLSQASQKKYWTHGVLAGGNDRGFFCIYTQGPGTMMFMCSNSHEAMGDQASEVGKSLARLVMSE